MKTLALASVIAVGMVIAASTFTPGDITAITVASAALIAAIFTGIVNIITALRTTRKVDENTAATNEVKAEVQVVAGHVNSAASASLAKIEALQKEVADTRAQIAELKQLAALLAQTTAVTHITQSVHPTGEGPTNAEHKSTEHLKEIEKNTKDTVITLTDAMTDSTRDIIKEVRDDKAKPEKGT